MTEFKDKIPVLSDAVGDSGRDPCGERVPDSTTFDALVDSLYGDFMDSVTRSVHEMMSREESQLRTAIRAHLEVMLPEIMEQWQKECADARRREDAAEDSDLDGPSGPAGFGRDYPGALEPMVAVPSVHKRKRRK